MKTSMKSRWSLCIALAAIAAGAFAFLPAAAHWSDDTWVEGSLVDVQVSVEGRPAPLYGSPQGDSRHYFQAIEGRNYSVVLRNNTHERVGVLIAVDGLNVVSGERTNLSPNESMYVLSPWETTTIQGWRTSLDDVRRFVFVDEKRSYAERTGQANGDMGWIRVLAFREHRPWWATRRGDLWGGRPGYDERGGREEARDRQPRAQMEQEAAPSAPSPTREGAPSPSASSEYRSLNKSAGEKNESLADRSTGDSYPGTGWGEQRHDSVRQVAFTAERVATDQHVLRYEYASGLRALGIFPNRDRDRLRDRDNGTLGFAQPPKW